MSQLQQTSLPRLIASTDPLGTPCPLEDPLGPDDYALSLDEVAHDPGVQAPVSVYIHLPFCPSRCLSCDHASLVTHDTEVIDDYIAALDQEMTLVTARLGNGRELRQLHLGGGTPNYLTDTQLMRLMSIVERHFTVTDNTETSLEASPKRTSHAQLALLRGLGFRRINFEVRDIDSEVQKALGRAHSLPILLDVFENARACGFETISMDLVYGLPNQTVASMRKTLEAALELAPERLLCLAYSRRPDTFRHQRSLDASAMPSLADRMVMFNLITETLEAAEYQWIGLDCFLHKDDELLQAQQAGKLRRNRIGYTCADADIRLGFGMHAVSELPGLVVQNHPDLQRWRDELWVDRLPVEHGARLSEQEMQTHTLLNTLLCNGELATAPDQLLDDDSNPLSRMREQGYIVANDSGGMAMSDAGRFVLHQSLGDASPVYRWASGF